VAHSTREGMRVNQKIVRSLLKSLMAFVALNRLAPTYGSSTPPLVDFSLASPLNLFEKPAKRSSFTLLGAML